MNLLFLGAEGMGKSVFFSTILDMFYYNEQEHISLYIDDEGKSREIEKSTKKNIKQYSIKKNKKLPEGTTSVEEYHLVMKYKNSAITRCNLLDYQGEYTEEDNSTIANRLNDTHVIIIMLDCEMIFNNETISIEDDLRTMELVDIVELATKNNNAFDLIFLLTKCDSNNVNYEHVTDINSELHKKIDDLTKGMRSKLSKTKNNSYYIPIGCLGKGIKHINDNKVSIVITPEDITILNVKEAMLHIIYRGFIQMENEKLLLEKNNRKKQLFKNNVDNIKEEIHYNALKHELNISNECIKALKKYLEGQKVIFKK